MPQVKSARVHHRVEPYAQAVTPRKGLHANRDVRQANPPIRGCYYECVSSSLAVQRFSRDPVIQEENPTRKVVVAKSSGSTLNTVNETILASSIPEVDRYRLDDRAPFFYPNRRILPKGCSTAFRDAPSEVRYTRETFSERACARFGVGATSGNGCYDLYTYTLNPINCTDDLAPPTVPTPAPTMKPTTSALVASSVATASVLASPTASTVIGAEVGATTLPAVSALGIGLGMLGAGIAIGGAVFAGYKVVTHINRTINKVAPNGETFSIPFYTP